MAEPPILAVPMLAVRGVATFYGAIQALHGVDLEVARGEIVALIGANGAGKSTLLMTICGRPTGAADRRDRKSTRLNSSHANISYAVFCLKKKKMTDAAPHD